MEEDLELFFLVLICALELGAGFTRAVVIVKMLKVLNPGIHFFMRYPGADKLSFIKHLIFGHCISLSRLSKLLV